MHIKNHQTLRKECLPHEKVIFFRYTHAMKFSLHPCLSELHHVHIILNLNALQCCMSFV